MSQVNSESITVHCWQPPWVGARMGEALLSDTGVWAVLGWQSGDLVELSGHLVAVWGNLTLSLLSELHWASLRAPQANGAHDPEVERGWRFQPAPGSGRLLLSPLLSSHPKATPPLPAPEVSCSPGHW